ncbi:MAG: biosynthetic-type acetolactate synthase large subunit, partial [Lachnospiraceae bacterium]|nr:biosynthetic-type acetolactate synthase large subunit [Lachnospiraceae bacterium]
MEIKGSELFVKALKEEGVDTVFAYPGGNNTDLLDELYKNKDIRVILPRHEQALIHEAEGYAVASGKPGVCLVTSGPGATNTVTGIADAHYDSIPLVIFTGQVPRPLIGNDAFQEVDIIGMTRQIVKFGMTVRERKELSDRLKMAFYVANTGKKGPVILDIPKDVQTEMGPSDYPKEIHMRSYRPPEGVHVGQLKKAFSLLSSAKRPLILAGHGVMMSGAGEALSDLAETMNIPVVTTILGNGTVPHDSPCFVGNAGMHGRYAANMAITHCDVLFSIGTRFNDRITGELSDFAKNAKIIHVDVDTASISRNVVVDIPVVADAKTALLKLKEWAASPSEKAKEALNDWLSTIASWEKEHPLSLSVKDGISPQNIMEAIDEVFPEGIVTLDVGQHQMWATQFLPVKKERPVITSGGLGTMGFGVPAAIGAKAACSEKKV